MLRRPFALAAVVAVVVAVVVVFMATRDDEAPESASSCFVLLLAPTPTSGGSFEASVRPRSGCEDPGELLGGEFLGLRDGDRTVAYLETPDKVHPPDRASTTSAGQRVDRPVFFRLPELNEGRYTLCSTFSTESGTNERACATFEVS